MPGYSRNYTIVQHTNNISHEMYRTSYTTAVTNNDMLKIISAPKNENFQKNSPGNSRNWLLSGERVICPDFSVGYQSDESRIEVNIVVTNYRICFLSVPNFKNIPDVTLGSISNIKKMGHSKVSRGENSYGIEIKCKDMRKIILYFDPANHSRRNFFENLRLYAFPNTNNMPLFATVYKGLFKQDGWNIYNAREEFQRMGIPNGSWDFTDINKDYSLSPTYPSCLVLPNEAIDKGPDFIVLAAKFRSKNRLPVLSWCDKNTKASITRSSQPMVGIPSKRSRDDETLIQTIINANPHNKSLLILDARPLVNARVNRALGGGYEEGYDNCELEFLDIQNIHVIRDSLKKIRSACYPHKNPKNNKKIADSQWLMHVQSILSGAKKIVSEISTYRRSILVHCSDGWDRTAQVVGLATLQLDPYYRTLEGFIVLIEKEWCSFGHKFANRIGHGEDKHKDEERSPIFVQFIDCVWQLLNQYNNAFEFNVHLLKTILDELYACRFGTFLYNNEKQRNDSKATLETNSLWSYVLEDRRPFINELYNPSITSHTEYFLYSEHPYEPILWKDYYCRHNPQVSMKEKVTLDSPGKKILGSKFTAL